MKKPITVALLFALDRVSGEESNVADVFEFFLNLWRFRALEKLEFFFADPV